MKVYPVEGRKIRDPLTRRFVPEDGRDVSDTDPFWARCVFQGDLTTEAPLAAKKTDEAPIDVEKADVEPEHQVEPHEG